jgi:hypothetical protein
MENKLSALSYKLNAEKEIKRFKSLLEYLENETKKEKVSDKEIDKDIYGEFLKFPFQLRFTNLSKCPSNLKIIATDLKVDILNIGEYNASDYKFYKSFLNKIKPYESKLFNIKQKRDLLPKLKIGDKYIPLFVNDFKDKEIKFIENSNGIQIFSFNSAFQNEKFFRGTSRISTAIKILRNTYIDDEELDNIQYNNIFISESSDYFEQEIKPKLDNLNLFDIKNLKNYFITDKEFDNSKEYFSYDIDLASEFFLIINEKGIIIHKGEFDETHRSLERQIKKLIKIKNGYVKEKKKEKILEFNEIKEIKEIKENKDLEKNKLKAMEDFYNHEDKLYNFCPQIKEDENVEIIVDENILISLGKKCLFF